MEDNKFVLVGVQNGASEHISAPYYSYWKSVFRKFFSSKIAITMLIISAIVILMAYIQPMFSGYSPVATPPHINEREFWFLRPSLENWFGTDNVGNSLFDAVWFGTRQSLDVAFISTAITTVVGVIVGMFWGYSKKMDTIMIEVYNILYNIPFTLLVIIMVYVLGPGKWQLIFALCCTSWLGTAYFIRVQVMIIRDREYNMASRCLGTPTHKVLLHNILPYLVSVIVTDIARTVPSFISYEVFLSYLGIGMGVEFMSLGQLINLYAGFMSSAAYLFWIPLIVSAIISVSLYVVGQTLADASDPRTHMM